MNIVIAIFLFFTGNAVAGTAPGEEAPAEYLSAVETVAAIDAKEVILKKARHKLEQYFPADRYRFSIRPRWIPSSLLRQKSRQIIAVELQGGVDRYTNFSVLYRHRNQKQRAQIQLIVEVKKNIPVVVRRVTSGSVIKKEDLEYQWVSFMQYSGELVENIKNLAGKTLRTTLLSGQPVRTDNISREYVIEAGDEVKIIIKREGIHVQVTGVARENGAKGDRIRIYSDETRRKYVGEVIRPGETIWKRTL